ncbi:MAG: DUF4143 domain-containing protein [Lentisphaeria bacterium]|nr:DUF4143 domain-containing protein [Lentisphaeria bacterium]
MKKYKKRIADILLARKLEGAGAVLIEGAKWCGKTTTAEQIAQSILYMSDPEKAAQYLEMAEIQPKLLLTGKAPRLLDEWQLAPKLWDAIRFEVDHRDGPGQFILTGSAVPPMTNDIHHSGTGRFSRLKMRPMSLFESGESNGDVSLSDLFTGSHEIAGVNGISIEQLAFLVCRGGWPRTTELRDQTALDQAFDYCDAVINSDVSRVDNISRDPVRTRKLLRSYARHQGTQAANTVIKSDMISNGSVHVDDDTLYSYLSALKRIFVIEDMEAWNPNLRSKTAIRTSDTRYFVDPSIATAVLGLGPEDLINDLNTFGLLFETLCIRDLRVYANAINGQVYHYRDAANLECDAVIHLRNGKYGLVEIKLGGEKLIEEGAKVLKQLEEKIDTSQMNSPAFKMVLTGTGDYAYCRKDGIFVIPIGCIKY